MRATNEEIRTILVHVGLDRLGDGLLKLPFIRALRQAYPAAHLTWFAGKETSVYARSLAPLVDGLLDEVIEYGGVGNSAWELIKPRPLRDRHFDLVIDTQRIFWTSLSARRIRHSLFISPAAKFLLSDLKPAFGYKRAKAMQRQVLDLAEVASGQSFDLPTRLELNIPDERRAEAAALLPSGPSDETYIGFAPGSGGRPKCWPLARYIEVAKTQTAQGLVPVFLIGPQEEDWVDEIKATVPGVRLPLQENGGPAAHGYDPLLTIALAERLSVGLSNDSGIAHMMAVGGTPLVVLYGPTVYEKFPPMTEQITALRAEEYGDRNINSIPVDPVVQALNARRRHRCE